MVTTSVLLCDAQDKRSGPDRRESISWSQVRGAEKPVLNEGFQHPP